eukprot:jgi/Chlat1/4406/Chrsp29S08900
MQEPGVDGQLEIVQAIVFENGDLLRLIIKFLCPKDGARVRCVNKQWKQAADDVEDDYYHQRWPLHAKLRSHLCYKEIARVNEWSKLNLSSNASKLGYLAFIMLRYMNRNLLLPHESQLFELLEVDCNGNVIQHYGIDGDCSFGPATQETLHSMGGVLGDQITLDIFVVRASDGELLHIPATRCFVQHPCDMFADGKGMLRYEVCIPTTRLENSYLLAGGLRLTFEKVQRPEDPNAADLVLKRAHWHIWTAYMEQLKGHLVECRRAC